MLSNNRMYRVELYLKGPRNGWQSNTNGVSSPHISVDPSKFRFKNRTHDWPLSLHQRCRQTIGRLGGDSGQSAGSG